jgi:dihydroorotate dehydrogenase electron transfer subunit
MAKNPKQFKAKVVSNKKVGYKYYKLTICAPYILRNAVPGEFVEIKIDGPGAPLLRRPLSIHGCENGAVELLYEAIGDGTRILAQKTKGDSLDIIGPLGNGFTYCNKRLPSTRPLLIAGGMGVAPLLFLASKLHNPLVLIGARTKSQILCTREFKKMSCDLEIATDDGSAGFKGKVTDILKKILNTKCSSCKATIYACGPYPMLKAIADIAKKNKMDAQVSLEAHMACGIGACLGCAVESKNGYKRVCKDGPVFRADDIIWREG